MDPQLAVWVGLIIAGLIGAVGYVGRLYVGQVEGRLGDMTVDRDWWRTRALSMLDVADDATSLLEKEKGAV